LHNKISMPISLKIFVIFLLTFLIVINIISFTFIMPFEKSIVYALKSFLPLSVSDKFCLLLVLNISFFIFLFALFYNLNKKTNTLVQKYEDEKKRLIEQHKQEIEKKNQYIKKLSAIGKETAKANAEKSEFFYNISHELKTPLTRLFDS
jgi:two-component system cell cycle sensor histidine kinase PleC